MEHRKVLFIAYYYPPLGGVGSLRSQKFACYLPEYGWQPIVLAPQSGGFFLDHSLEDGSDRGIEVIRTPFINLSSIFKASLMRSAPAAPSAEQVKQSYYPKQETNPVLKWVRGAIHNWVYIPDAQIGWFPHAQIAGRELLAKNEIDAIWSSSFPITAHLIAYRLKQATGRPWIADFRDLWTENQCANYTSRLRKRIDQTLESRLLEKADLITTVSETLADSLRRLTRGRTRVEVIRNGFDAGEFAAVEPAPPQKWTITFVGTYYPFYDPTPFLAALQRLIRKGAVAREDVRFQIVCAPHPDLQSLVRKFELDDVAHFTGVVPHREALKYQVESTLLLFTLHGDQANSGIITGKLFEYLGARRPILAITSPDFEAARIINESAAGTVFSPNDAEGIERYLSDSYSAFKAGVRVKLGERDLSRYERRGATQRLADLLSETVPIQPSRNGGPPRPSRF